MRLARRPDLLSRSRRAAAALCFLLLSPVLAGAAVLTPSEYAERLGRAAQGMERAARASENASRLADEALAVVPEREKVRVPPAASTLSADNRDLLARLRRDVTRGPAGMEEAARTLRSLQAGVAGTAPAPPEGAKALAAVLARREFRPSLFQRLREWYGDLKGRLLRYVFEHFPSLPADMHVPVNLWRVVGYGALLAAGLVVMVLVARLTLRAAAARPEEALVPGPEEEWGRPHAEWLAEAERLLRAHHYGPAVRAVYLAALMRLDETGRLSYDRARADGRSVGALRAKGEQELARELLGLCRIFSRTWYGLAPTGAEEYDAARQTWHRLEAMTRP